MIKDENNWVLERCQNIFLFPLQNGTTEIHLKIFATKPNLQYRIARLRVLARFFCGDIFVKLLLLIALTCITATVSVSTAAFGLPSTQLLSQSSRNTSVTPSPAPSSDINVPVCYIQMPNSSQLIDLSRICGKDTQNSPRLQVTYPKPPTPYNQSAIKKFDNSVYGEGN